MEKFKTFWNYQIKKNGDILIGQEELQHMLDQAYESGYNKGVVSCMEIPKNGFSPVLSASVINSPPYPLPSDAKNPVPWPKSTYNSDECNSYARETPGVTVSARNNSVQEAHDDDSGFMNPPVGPDKQ